MNAELELAGLDIRPDVNDIRRHLSSSDY